MQQEWLFTRARVNTREKRCYSSYFDAKQIDLQIVVCSYRTPFGATIVATTVLLANTAAVRKNTAAARKNTAAVLENTAAVWKNTNAV